MNPIIRTMEERMKELDDVLERAHYILKKAPEGNLRISKSQNRTQYYQSTGSSKRNGEYIKGKDYFLACQLAQKDYANKVIKSANKERVLLEKIRKSNVFYEWNRIIDEMSAARKSLINPFYLCDEQFQGKWKEELLDKKEQSNKNYNLYRIDEEQSILTDAGELVRSKSEKIIADKLYARNITYVYEAPLYLKGYGYIRPDFTILNKKTRKEIYWEHFGIMDKTEYCDKAIKKIEEYHSNNLYMGRGLLLSFETRNHILNVNNIENMIKEYLE